MAMSDFLIQVGNYKIPLGLMAVDTYDSTIHGQDIDSYVDANGELHRNPLKHQRPEVVFKTKNYLTDAEFTSLMANIRANYLTSEIEKDANVTAYYSEIGDYKTCRMYLADIKTHVVTTREGFPRVDSAELAFVSY